MLTPDFLKAKFSDGLTYDRYVDTGTPPQIDAWKTFEDKVALTDTQSALIASFTREINVLFVSGVWCGDCSQQLPMFAHIERANPERLRVRYLDRDQHADLAQHLKICGGSRVPVGLLLNEDFDVLALVGDRTLSRYRAMAARNLGAACALPGAEVAGDEAAATLQDWVDEIERAHLIARLSTKLRQRHGD